MDGLKAYKYYASVKRHFDIDSYSAFTYNFQAKIKPETFNKRNDKYFFTKLGLKYPAYTDIIALFVGNAVHDRNPGRWSVPWVGDLLPEHGIEFVTRRDSLMYRLRDDAARLAGRLQVAEMTLTEYTKSSTDWSKFLVDYYSGKLDIGQESLSIMVSILKPSGGLDSVIWPVAEKRIAKLQEFLVFNRAAAAKVILDEITKVS